MAPPWSWRSAAAELGAFVGRCLPGLLSAQAQSYFAQLRTVTALRDLEDALDASAGDPDPVKRAKVIRLCTQLSNHVAPAVARLSPSRQLHFRKILERGVATWQLKLGEASLVPLGEARSEPNPP